MRLTIPYEGRDPGSSIRRASSFCCCSSTVVYQFINYVRAAQRNCPQDYQSSIQFPNLASCEIDLSFTGVGLLRNYTTYGSGLVDFHHQSN